MYAMLLIDGCRNPSNIGCVTPGVAVHLRNPSPHPNDQPIDVPAWGACDTDQPAAIDDDCDVDGTVDLDSVTLSYRFDDVVKELIEFKGR